MKGSEKTLYKILILSIYSISFSMTCVYGKTLYREDRLAKVSEIVSPLKFMIFLIIAVGLSVGLLFASKALKNFNIKKIIFLPKFFKSFIFPTVLIFGAYLIIYLAFYPGVWCYDMPEQNQMAIGIVALTKHHPPIHTLIWSVFYHLEVKTGGKICGIAAYSILQMIINSCAYGFLLKTIAKLIKNDIIYIISFAYFLLNPVLGMFSFIPTKDGFFCVFFVLALTCILTITVETNEKKKISEIVVAGIMIFLASLFRNNMIYAVLVSGVLIVIFSKSHKKEILLTFAGVLVGYFLINSCLYGALGFSDSESREMLSAPMQQIARVCKHNYDELDEEVLGKIDLYFDSSKAREVYNPRIADPIKNIFDSKKFDDNKVEFAKLWLAIGLKYPKEYAEAYLSLYSPYWYLFSDEIDDYVKIAYIEDYILQDEYYPFPSLSKIPQVYSVYDRIARGGGESIPGVSILLSLGLPLWLYSSSLLLMLFSDKKRNMPMALLGLVYLMTFFLGPVCIIRYIFPLLAGYPIIVVSLLINGKRQNTKE